MRKKIPNVRSVGKGAPVGHQRCCAFGETAFVTRPKMCRIFTVSAGGSLPAIARSLGSRDNGDRYCQLWALCRPGDQDAGVDQCLQRSERGIRLSGCWICRRIAADGRWPRWGPDSRAFGAQPSGDSLGRLESVRMATPPVCRVPPAQRYFDLIGGRDRD